MNKVTNVQLMKKLVEEYDESDQKWGQKAMNIISEHFANQTPNAKAVDPDRLTTKLVFVSQLRKRIIEKVGPMDVDGQADFNKLSVDEQLRFQKQSLVKDINRWVHNVQIAPANIQALKLSDQEVEKQRQLRDKVQAAKLRTEMLEIEFPKMKERLLHALVEPQKQKPQAVVAALLLASGRRTVEIMKTGAFTLNEEMTMDGYEAVFSGQAKDSLFGTGPYAIPLLAPFRLVHAAMQVVRDAFPTDDLSNEAVTAKYNKSLNNFIQRKLGPEFSAHTLRGIYAMATYELFNDKKISLIGWVSRVLGHSKVSNASFYTTTKIQEPSVFTPPAEAEEQLQVDDGWVASNKPEQKRVQAIKEMMLKRLKITASSVRAHSGGSMAVIARTIEKNQDRINAYNQSLIKK